jgi:transposase, IS30 family
MDVPGILLSAMRVQEVAPRIENSWCCWGGRFTHLSSPSLLTPRSLGVVAERSRFGDWEADLVLGRRGSGAIATHVERKSRYLMASLLSDRKAETFNASAIPVYQSLPQGIRQTLTLDNGKEFSRFKELETGTGLKVFFADAYSAWQRGTNENINGLLRFYFPKGMSFKRVSEKALANVIQKINNRPRKCLGYRTPQEVLNEASGGALAM